MKSTRYLRLRLRLIEGALVLTLGALTMGAVATHQILLDANNRPASDVSLSSSHWTGTLDAARLPASVPLLDDSYKLAVEALDVSRIYANTDDRFTVIEVYGSTNYLTSSGDIALQWTGSGVTLPLTLSVVGPSSLDNGLSGTDGSGNVYAGNSFYLGNSTSGAGVYGPSGAVWTDDGADGWTGNNVAISGSGEIDATAFHGDGSGITNLNVANLPDTVPVLGASLYGSDDSLVVNGDLEAHGPFGLIINGTSYIDSDGNYRSAIYNVIVDPYGNGSFNNLTAQSGGGFFGQSVSSQPATPTDLAGVIAILQAYGLCQ